MKIIHIGAIISGLLLSGCSVMHFKNGTVESRGGLNESWHHNGVYSLVEFSQPIDMTTLCTGRSWSQITTKETFVTGFVGGLDNAVIGLVVPVVPIDIWDPQALEWYCGDATVASGTAPAPAVSPADPAK